MMIEIRALKPAPDRRVRTPDGELLAVEGEDLAMTTFWRRRLDAGDVVPAEPKPPQRNSRRSKGDDA